MRRGNKEKRIGRRKRKKDLHHEANEGSVKEGTKRGKFREENDNRKYRKVARL